MGIATEQVLLTIPELLGMIMALLHFKDLMTAMRVCRAWKHCININPSTRRTLFLLAEPATGKHRFTRKYGIAYEANIHFSVKLSHLLAELNDFTYKDSGHYVKVGPALGLTYHVKKPGRFLNIMFTAWREMFVTQPPCTEIAVGTKDSCFYPLLQVVNNKIEAKNVSWIQAPGGVKLGMLIDECVRLGLQGDNFVRVQYVDVASGSPRASCEVAA